MPDISIEILWEQMHGRLCRFVCSRFADEADAEDILQDVFLKIHANLGKVRDVERIESWIYQIARNCIADYYRGRRRLVPLPELAVRDEYPEEDAAESLAPSVREIVESLPEPYREALILTEYQGLSQAELAERLGISLSGAKSRVQRARQKIKDILLACCHFEFDARGLVYDYREHCCGCEERCA
jgi:RNA polymerase sigma-70 factor (ECF subfamily)